MAENEVKALKEAPQPFHILLSRLEGGLLHADLGDKLNELNGELAVHAAQNGKAKGSISLKLTFVHQRNGMVEVTADVKTDAPKTPRESSILFVTEGSNLTVENPKQQTLPLRDVNAGQEKVRELPPDPAARKA